MVVTKVVVGASYRSGADIVVEREGGGGAQNTDVIVFGAWVILWVVDDLLNIVDYTTTVCPGGTEADTPSAGCVPTVKNMLFLNYLVFTIGLQQIYTFDKNNTKRD